MKALVYHGPGQRTWERVPDPTVHRADRRDRPHRLVHDLRHRPSHPQGRPARGEAGTVLGHEAVERSSRSARPSRRSLPATGCSSRASPMRALPLLQGGPLRALQRRRRLDLRPPDRRPAGRVRARAVRRHIGLQSPRGVERRAGALSRRHPPDRVRGRRPQRPVEPGDTVAIVGAGPIGLAAIMTAKLTRRAVSSRSTSTTSGLRRRSSSAPTSRSTTATKTPSHVI